VVFAKARWMNICCSLSGEEMEFTVQTTPSGNGVAESVLCSKFKSGNVICSYDCLLKPGLYYKVSCIWWQKVFLCPTNKTAECDMKIRQIQKKQKQNM